MLKRNYTNFVRASTPVESEDVPTTSKPTLSGAEARQIYLEEVKNAGNCTQSRIKNSPSHRRHKPVRSQDIQPVSDKELFLAVQSNDIQRLRLVLDNYPEKLNAIDDYGWSLLMIACQADSVDIVKELLERGIDDSVRDKGGNSARTLVIKNKNYVLADVLLNHKHDNQLKVEEEKVKMNEEFLCEICNKIFPDRDDHLSSTLHNISASKGKKIQASYGIPQSNRGFQIMLKVGWDKDSGLGKDGSGKIYPIKVVKKEDRKGLGHVKRKIVQLEEEKDRHKTRKKLAKDYCSNRKFEINFRREFY